MSLQWNVFGEPFCSKVPPLDFIDCWLAKYAIPNDIPGKYVHMDQGDKLGHCPNVITHFESAGNSIKLTAPDASHQNGPVE